MTSDEFALDYHFLKFKCTLFERKGKSFQDFFEQIMQIGDPSFKMVKPVGREGDWKSDGYSSNWKTVYQCYAPDSLRGKKTVGKIIEDFEGAKERWQDKMQKWVFVWSSESALPPQVIALLEDLKSTHRSLEIGDMGRAGLWDIVKGLPVSDRQSLLGPIPTVSNVPTMSAAEIQVLMTYLGKQMPVTNGSEGVDLTAIAEKLQRNSLSGAVTNMVMPSVPVANLVRKYVTGMPDPDFSRTVAFELAEKYGELAASTEDPDVIFGSIVEYVLGERRAEPKFFWAAVGIVTYYFELCDIFEA